MSNKAFSVCSKVGQPSEASASALAKLFGHGSKPGPSRKRSFDPSADCVVASQRYKKKATNQRMKMKTVTVVLLKEKPAVVPKGRSRTKLRDSGRVKKLQFKRCTTVSEVRSIITGAFSEFEDIATAQYLHCGQDNIMVVNENQELDGSDLIDLAGQGSLYLTQKRVSVSGCVAIYFTL